jgi:hypothetical protein
MNGQLCRWPEGAVSEHTWRNCRVFTRRYLATSRPRGLRKLWLATVDQVNQRGLEWEKDCCYEKPATKRNVPITNVKEEDCHVYDKNHQGTPTLGYSTVGDIHWGLIE